MDGVSVDLIAGAVTALVGPSGSGKSSLLRIVAGLDRPDEGTVTVDGVNLTSLSAAGRRKLRRTKIGYVFQRPSDNLIPYLTVMEHMQLAAKIRSADHGEAADLLERLGIAHRAGNRPDQLSGGEQQRLAFGLAAIGQPPLMIADEPTAELDSGSGQRLMQLIASLAERGSAVVIATHDPEVAGVADRSVVLDEGRVVS
ncbi:MAG: ABC transporter ATP-binding protein [Actinomycetota bacterium]